MNYRRIGSRARGLFRYADLYDGGDHLLYVQSSRFSDNYYRFAWADITALVVTEHPLWSAGRMAWVGLSLLATISILLGAPGWHRLWALFPACVLLWALLDAARGPRCKLMLHTAVSRVPIEAVRRSRAAAYAVPVLASRIRAAQQELEALPGAAAPHAIAARVDLPEGADTAGGRPHLLLHVLFAAMAAHVALLGVFYLIGQLQNGFGMSPVMLIGELLMAVLVLRRREQLGVPLAVLGLAIAVFCVADLIVAGYSFGKALADVFEAAQRRETGTELKYPYLMEQTAVRALWHSAAALAGWLLLLTRRENKA